MSESVTITNEPAETVPLPELPRDFFRGVRPRDKSWGEKQEQLRGMLWYDSIIDDLLSHPGTHLQDTAKRLNKAPNTIYLICGSDLFKARYAQRRAQFNADLDQRLTGKVAKVAELALDATISHLEKKHDAVPLQHLKEIGKDALDRLGYGVPKVSSPSVVVNNHNSAQAVVANQVSGESLARARAAMKLLNESQANPGPVEVEGHIVRAEGES
jgi:hypothetical protein